MAGLDDAPRRSGQRPVPAEAATGRVISELATELDRVGRRRDALAAEIQEAFRSHPSGELLASMPGIGPRTGARLLAEVGDGSAFASGSKLATYPGLAPVTRQSGTSFNGESRSRRGNHRVKNAMPRRIRRRCDVILAMLRTGDPYQPARPAPSLAEAA